MRNSVLSVIDAALVHYLLCLERKKHCQRLCVESSEAVDLPDTKGENGIETVRLLPLKDSHLAVSAFCNGLNTFSIEIELLLAVRRDGKGNKTEHHALITGRKICKEFFRLSPLKLHIVRDYSREVIVLVLFSLPVGDVCLNTKESVFNLSYRFICRNGKNIDRKHEVPVHIC